MLSTVTAPPPAPSRRATILSLAVAMTFPTALAWLYFVVLGGTGKPNAIQQASYAVAKTLQFAIPLFFCVVIARRWPSLRTPKTEGLVLGLGFGLVVSAAMIAAYFGALRSSPLLAEAPGRIRQKLDEFGVSSGAAFLGLGLFIAVVHSFLEEYYWRWFVFGQMRALMPVWAAVVVSSLGFMSHHVLIIHAYLPDRPWSGVLPASLGVAVGGAVWAWLYHKAGSLVAPWLSHALVDIALFAIGWNLMSRT